MELAMNRTQRTSALPLKLLAMVLLSVFAGGCGSLQFAQNEDNTAPPVETVTDEADEQPSKAMWIWVAPAYRDAFEHEGQSYVLQRVPKY